MLSSPRSRAYTTQKRNPLADADRELQPTNGKRPYDPVDYLFEDRFGRPGKGNDKGKVEGIVGYCLRDFWCRSKVPELR